MTTRAIATKPGEPTLRVELTASEEQERADEVVVALADKQAGRDRVAAETFEKASAEQRIKTKLGLTDEDIEDLIKILK